MKAVRFTGPMEAEVVEMPPPTLQPGEVRVKVARAGICGSDIHRYHGTHFFGTGPIVPGHECAGTVVEVPPGVDAQVGQRVAIMPMTTCGECPACRQGRLNQCQDVKVMGPHRPGCYAEEVPVLASMLRPLPDEMSFDEGALVEPTAVAVHCVNRGQVEPGERVAVLGAGSIGLLIQQVANAKGAGYIFSTGRVDGKMALARQMGADETANVTREEVVTSERTDAFDLVFDTVCSHSTSEQAIALARPGGRIVILAAPHGEQIGLNYNDFYRKELAMRAARLYDADFDEAMPLIASGRVRPLPIVTHRYPLADAPRALREVVENRRDVVKVLLLP
ncbi:MAG: alcohol dehydrogenase catalytic domain-containing protein [Bacteroidetes bacterium]|nr:alcohol dehydrogenase catalytic domain-containing protein [Bacteroidota bacterium]MCL5026129.1 alcohol dehydrogenase catalytic domain-containing protein [Chloroflexota bacterium]